MSTAPHVHDPRYEWGADLDGHVMAERSAEIASDVVRHQRRTGAFPNARVMYRRCREDGARSPWVEVGSALPPEWRP